jgi:prepilin-type N-terminal cleavage/methylation domain-containing protein
MERAPGNSTHTRRPRRRGFTLIESAMVTVIVGVGCVGMLQLLATGTMSNAEGTEQTVAINLASNIREMSLGMSFYDPQQPTMWNTKEATVAEWDNIMDLDGAVFSPPLDARRQPIGGYPGWSQAVEVESVSEANVNLAVPDTTGEPTARVTVSIRRHGISVYKISWLAVAPRAL